MAEVQLDPLFRTISGRLGDVVFRTVRGKTYMYASPRASAKEPSPAQLAQRARFGRAAKARAAEAKKAR